MAYLVSIPVYNSCLFLRKWANHIEINVGASVVDQTWLYQGLDHTQYMLPFTCYNIKVPYWSQRSSLKTLKQWIYLFQ